MDKKHIWVILLVVAVAFGVFAGSAYWLKEKSATAAGSAGPTLLDAQSTLKVGIRGADMLGMIEPSKKKGMEADLAKAIQAAIGAPRIEWVPVGLSTRFTNLDLDPSHENYIHVTIRAVTLNSQRDIDLILKENGVLTKTGIGYEFGPIYYYDGTNVILHDGIPLETDPVNVIVAAGSSTQTDMENLRDGLIKGRDWPDKWMLRIAYESAPGADDASTVAEDAFADGTYTDPMGTYDDPSDDVTYVIHGYAGDGVACKHQKKSLKIDRNLYFEPPITKSPLAFLMKEGDANWAEVVTWVFNVLVAAEEEGYDQDNYNTIPDGWAPDIPGLSPNWAREVIKKVGNYGDIWKRNFETDPRGENNLWNNECPNKGLMYSPPL